MRMMRRAVHACGEAGEHVQCGVSIIIHFPFRSLEVTLLRQFVGDGDAMHLRMVRNAVPVQTKVTG
ncbi:hypothetical protein RCH10_000994 [Variovorax sp. GrIS 2.14]